MAEGFWENKRIIVTGGDGFLGVFLERTVIPTFAVLVEGEQARDENTGEDDCREMFFHGLTCKFRKPLIRGSNEGRRLVVFASGVHQPENNHRRDEATIGPREKVKRRQHELEEIGGEENHPVIWRLDAF